ncbi:pentraxin-4 isoform X3 [Hippopotamus amphibius kiboko]|uniref:pentraxin-4 isoform X3 n=1 Tax=Hippopotamus amphibius kiboko TaxID=575201 RepID=UPI002591F0BA|nr:pentraxin-4 isoform X3 [Hippopotamus amphibius kiboko]
MANNVPFLFGQVSVSPVDQSLFGGVQRSSSPCCGRRYLTPSQRGRRKTTARERWASMGEMGAPNRQLLQLRHLSLLRMGCTGRKTLPFFLIFVPIYLHGASSQETAPVGQRKPFFERLRRLEEQFRRFQEVTLTHLQGIASNYNLSFDIEARFQSLARESHAVCLALNQSQATVQGDLDHLKTWVRKTQRRGRKVDHRLLALGAALSERSRQRAQERKEQETQRDTLSGLALDVRALQDALARLTPLVQNQGARLATLEGRLQVASTGTVAPSVTPALPRPSRPSSPKLQGDRQASRALPEPGDPPLDFACRLQGAQEPPGPGIQRAWPSESPEEICNVGHALIFPNASTANVVFLRPGFLTGLQALSICSWVRTASGHLGTLLSYATEENDNKLVLHGRDSLAPGSIHFVIGDPAFRELPLQPLLDGQWHHVCVIWTSILGRYWLHMDRRLVATGSRFREGYEIPPGGSLVVGQEQDSVGGGFDGSEAFVGSIAGLAIWDRVLIPGEVSNLATGKELPTGAILTLANATSVGGFVQRVNCTCLQLCP